MLTPQLQWGFLCKRLAADYTKLRSCLLLAGIYCLRTLRMDNLSNKKVILIPNFLLPYFKFGVNNMNTRKILSGGRVTIPAELRKKYGTKPGTKIFINEEKDGIKIFRAVTEKEVYFNVGFMKT